MIKQTDKSFLKWYYSESTVTENINLENVELKQKNLELKKKVNELKYQCGQLVRVS